jgi:hypothetical protein
MTGISARFCPQIVASNVSKYATEMFATSSKMMKMILDLRLFEDCLYLYSLESSECK